MNLSGLDAAAAVDLAAGLGELEVRGVVLAGALLIAQRVGQVFVERAVPRAESAGRSA